MDAKHTTDALTAVFEKLSAAIAETEGGLKFPNAKALADRLLDANDCVLTAKAHGDNIGADTISKIQSAVDDLKNPLTLALTRQMEFVRRWIPDFSDGPGTFIAEIEFAKCICQMLSVVAVHGFFSIEGLLVGMITFSKERMDVKADRFQNLVRARLQTVESLDPAEKLLGELEADTLKDHAKDIVHLTKVSLQSMEDALVTLAVIECKQDLKFQEKLSPTAALTDKA